MGRQYQALRVELPLQLLDRLRLHHPPGDVVGEPGPGQ